MSKSLQFSALPTAQEMQQWDKLAMDMGIPEFTLMENAAREALYVLYKLKKPLNEQVILLFMGNGNNGGDAAALARHLHDIHARPLILHTKSLELYTKTAAEHIKLAQLLQIPFVQLPEDAELSLENLVPESWQNPSIIIDGLLGTGFVGNVRPQFERAIGLINKLRQQAFVLALDIPSGCSSVEFNEENHMVRAHSTVCFAAAKPSLIMPSAKQFTGELFVRNIGMPRMVMEKCPASFNLISAKGIKKFLQTLPADSHKGTWGHVLVLGGSKGLCGAASLAARAALRSGAGLVSVAAPSMLCAEIKANVADIMTLGLGGDYTWPKKIPQNLQEKLEKISAIALGPGLGISEDAVGFMHNILKYAKRPRLIIDADALNILVKNPKMLKLLREDDILTPHPGEAARLLGISSKAVQANRVNAIKKLTKLVPCAVILKGAASLLAQGSSAVFILPYDLPSLAVAGSGDVLSGCTAAFAARNPSFDALSVAALAMTVHATAGYLALDAFPMRGNTSSDLIELLPSAMADITKLPEVYHAEF